MKTGLLSGHCCGQTLKACYQGKFASNKNWTVVKGCSTQSRIAMLGNTKRARTLGGLTRDLHSQIANARCEYDTSFKHDENGDGKIVSETRRDFIGPDFSAVQLYATPNLTRLISLHAIGDCCGSRQSLTYEGDEEEEDVWVTISDQWKRPSLWMRHGRSAIEVDASSLVHWSQAMLTPEHGPLTSALSISVFHPLRVECDADAFFISEFQSVFELCGVGLAKIVHFGTFGVDVNSWDVTARNLSASVEKWTQKSPKEDALLVLVIWPNDGWYRTRSALAACAEHISSNVSVRLVTEEVVLMNRERRKRLVGLALSCYTMVCRKSFLSLPASEDEFIHVALALSRDSKWCCFAWTNSKGDFVLCDARADKNVVKALKFVAEATNRTKLCVLIDRLAPTDLVPPTVADLSVVVCHALNPWTDDDTLRRDFDNLAFLTTAMESPSRGPVSNHVLASLASKDELDVKMRLPLHLRCARRMAEYMNGMAPDDIVRQQ